MDTYPDVPLVSYADIRQEIRSGDRLLCSGTSPMSKMIKEATNSVWSHVAFLLRVESIDRIFVLESVESVGIAPATISYYLQDYQSSGTGYPGRVYIARDARFEHLPADGLLRFSQTAVDLFRRTYDRRECLGIAWRLMCLKAGRPMPPRAKDDAYTCAEYLEFCDCSVGFTADRQGDNFIAPYHFARPPTTILWELALAH